MNGKSKKKRSSRNLKITTRISLATILGFAIPVVIAVIFSSVFLHSITSYLNFSTVTTNSYSMLNQIQWNQTMSSISNELISKDSEQVKRDKVSGFVTPLEEFGTKIYIECNDRPFYSTDDKKEVLAEANAILPIDTAQNTYYFSQNGMVIVNHAESENAKYVMIAANSDYSVSDITQRHMAQDFSSLVFGRTGALFIAIILIFVLSIVALSIITSRTIKKPIQKLADGANEIARGNLDYKIDYDSTNEIGVTVDAFNHMAARLKTSIDKQAKIEQSRKEMIAGVAHDLRTPLTSVKGYVEGLRDGIANTPEKQERYLATIYASTLTMERLLDDLLTMSRLELGTIELNTDVIRVNDFLDDCAASIAPELEKAGFDFIYDNKCSDTVYTTLDTDRFSRVMMNIVSNSVKYAKKDVKGRLELSAQNYSKSVIISIADNGIGLDAESLPRIFEPLYRADKARSKTGEGSGIGLAVCKQIVELHGGHIWATGSEGKGLTILISLNITEVSHNNDEQENTDS